VLNQLLWLPLIFSLAPRSPWAFCRAQYKRIGLFLPATYLVNGLQQTIVNSATPGARYAEILSLAVWACLTFFLSAPTLSVGAGSQDSSAGKNCWSQPQRSPFVLLGVVENRTDRILLEAKSAFLL